MFLIRENGIVQAVSNIKKGREKLRFEAVLQTMEDVNRNRRKYRKNDFNEALEESKHQLKEGFLGELDHPLPSGDNRQDVVRQCTVCYKECSHRFLEFGWDGNVLKGVLETLRTPNGMIIKNLIEDGISVGFSFRGMGDVRKVTENGVSFNEVVSPIRIVTWDSVSYPSHPQARFIKLSESDIQAALEQMRNTYLVNESGIEERNGLICTEDGICYIPEAFDKLVEQKVIRLTNKFKI